MDRITRRARPSSPVWLLLALAIVAGTAPACGGAARAGAGGDTVRIGYFATLTHAPALVGLAEGDLARGLGEVGAGLEPVLFASGPAVVEALFSGSIDAALVGPNPAVNAYARSGGDAVRVVAGVTSGGAALVVRPGIRGAADLRGRSLATPALGNTQDVALRWWLAGHGLDADRAGGGDVSIRPLPGAEALDAYRQRLIDGAWLPEPWVSRLVLEAGAEVLVDERDLWAGGRFVTTQLVVRRAVLGSHPERVRALIEGLVTAIERIAADPQGARGLVGSEIERITTKALPPAVIDRAWSTLTFTWDPLAPTLHEAAAHAVAVDLLRPADLAGIHDLRLLNDVLRARGHPEVSP